MTRELLIALASLGLAGCGYQYVPVAYDFGLVTGFLGGLVVGSGNNNGTAPAGSTLPGSTPNVINVTVTTPENTPISINAPVGGGDTSLLTLTIAGNPSNGTTTVDSSTQSVTYTPASGFIGTDTFTVQVCDNSSPPLCGTATITVIVTAVDQPPTATPDTNSITEDATPNTVSGNVLANDSDPEGDTIEVSRVNNSGTNVGVSLSGTYGRVVIAGDGSYTYTLDNSLAIVQALNSAQTATDVFTYTAFDGTSGSDTTLTITIQGVDDVLTAAPDNASINEDASPNTVSGNVLSNDAAAAGQTVTVATVNGSSAFLGNAQTSAYGSIIINTDGTFTYTLDNSNPTVNALNAGDTLTEVFNYTAETNALTSSSTLTITINGVNDIPVVVADAALINEDDASVSGNVLLNDSDADGPSPLSVSQVGGTAGNVGASVPGTYGSVTINSDGSFTYSLDNTLNAVQALGAGESVADVFTYTASDGAAAVDSTLTVTIHGENDAPVAQPDVNSITKGTSDHATGNVLDNDTDVDAGDTKAVSQVNGSGANVGIAINTVYGSLTLNSNGLYSYALNNASPAVQALNPGQIVTDQFTYQVSDGSGASDNSTLTISISGGANDLPVARPDTGTIQEDQLPHTVSGNVLSNDTSSSGGSTLQVTAVSGNAGNVGMIVPSQYGQVVINADGSYVYTLNNSLPAVQALAFGTSVADTIAYTVSDGSGSAGSTLTIVVKGQNDPPQAAPDSYSVATGQTLAVSAGSGVLGNDHDIDTGDTLTAFPNTGPAHASAFVLNGDGSFNYTNDGSSSQSDSFTYHVDDEHGSSSNIVTVTISIQPGS